MTEGQNAMMEALREGAKGWVAKVLLGLVVVVFALLGVSSMDMNSTIQGFLKKDLATVGGAAIGSDVFDRNLQDTIRRVGITLEDARKQGLDRKILDQMLEQASLDAQSGKLGLAIGDAAALVEVQAEPMFADDKGLFSRPKFDAILRENRMNEAGYFATIKDEMQRRAVTSIASDNITLPRAMLEALTRYRDETRDGRYVSFTVSEADVPQPSADDLKKQYESTPGAYTAPEYRSIAVMKADPADFAAKLEVSEQELKDYYDTRKQEYFVPENRDLIQISFPDLAAAEKAKARITAGEDIAKIATEMKLKETDYLLKGKRKEDYIDPKIGEAVMALKEGEVSAPIKGTLDNVLIKIVKLNPDHQATFDEVKVQLTERLRNEKAQEELKNVYQVIEDDRAQQVKFEEIATKNGLTALIIPAISDAGLDKQDKPIELPMKDELLKSVYAGDVGLDSDALQTPEGAYVWFEIREVIPSAVRPFEEVKDRVTSDWKANKLRTLAQDKAKAIVEKAGADTKLETIATELGGTIKPVSAIKRNSVSEEFDAISAMALFSAPEKGLTWSLEGDGKSARIIEVSKVTPPAAMSAGAKEVADTAKQGLGADLSAIYIKAARAGADVTVNEELWRQIGGSTTTP